MGVSRLIGIIILCTAGLAISVVAYRMQWDLSELPPDPALQSLTYPVSIEDLSAGSPERLRFLAESWPPGSRLLIRDAAGTTVVVETVRRLGAYGLILTGVGGLVFLVVAVGFFAPRLHLSGIGRFFWVLFPYGLSIMLGGVFFPREDPVLVTALGFLQFLCLAVLPVTFLRLVLIFPRRSSILDRWRWLIPLLSAAAVGLVAWQCAVFHRYHSEPGLARESALGPALAVADLFMVTLTVLGVVIFAARNRSLELTREKNQVRWLLWGFAIGAAPYVFLRTLPELMGLPLLMPDHFDRIIELAIPLSFVMVVVRHQFLDIDVIIRRSLLYGLLAGVLISVYLVAGIVFGRLIGEIEGLDPWVLPVVLGLGAGIAFRPLRRALGGWIDRTFFKLAHDHDRTLERLDTHLAGVADQADVARRVHRTVAAALIPETATVILGREPDLTVVGDHDPGTASWALTTLPANHVLLAAAPRSTSRPEVETNDFPLDLLEDGVVLMQPLFRGDEVLGGLLLGRRSTGRRYVAQDLKFLAGCALVTGRHLERIALQQTVAEEALARRRLTELDRLKSQFLAQVAHDLRTPVAGIAWSARNLLEGLVGDLTPDQADYMGSIASSGAHLNRLVDNLLEISRLEEARQELTLTDVQAVDIWSEAMSTVRPLAEGKDVTLVMEGNEDVPLVRGHGDKLIEVTVNLLDNAVKYTAPGSTVTVSVHPAAADTLRISVRDQGPGLGGQDPAALLDRFAQGEPSPHSTRKGFGLGLHIAATYLDLMGGRLEAADHPEGGAVFTCTLPLSGTLPDSTSGNPDQGDEP